ncbi:MAG: beta-galactosidase [Clostridia bacterium]|nr:beta-galactosidase [Clostridia bacterium]
MSFTRIVTYGRMKKMSKFILGGHMLSIKIEREDQREHLLHIQKDKELVKANGRYAATGNYLTRDGKPWYPIMGEFHFSRCNPAFWREEIAKMKAGGIDILATYVFWIYHEERQGEWDFTGEKDLGEFVRLCREEDMPVLLRIGPWAHGECRNGGFPDWLVARKDLKLRSDDEDYLELVEAFWKKVYEQVDHMMYPQGGPVIGIQIENEYGHCGGLQGEAGVQHMKTLKAMAIKLGFCTSYYTATGWGGGIVPEGCLPVLAAYCGAPWEQHVHQMPPNANFVFSHYKDDKNVGSDLSVGEETGFSYDTEAMPYLMAELGGGLQVTGHRRPYVTAQDTACMALCKAGSGANLLGYYMYHGGTNPKGKYTSLQESKESGYINDLPVRSYDFQAPIGEYGSINEGYFALKPLHMFLKEFGELVAEGECILPSWNSENPSDMEAYRIGLRHLRGKGQGFLFYNRYQRHDKMDSKTAGVTIEEEKWQIEIPEICMEAGTAGWIPYAAQETDGMVLTPEFRLYSSNCPVLCRLGEDVVFFGEGEPEVVWQGSGDALFISKWEAEHALKYKEQLYVADGCLIQEKDKLSLITQKERNEIMVYPEEKREEVCCEPAEVSIKLKECEENGIYVEYELLIYGSLEKCHDLWINLDIIGDRGEFWTGDKAGDLEQPDGDWYYQGKTWKISWKYIGCPDKMIFRIYHAKSSEETYYEILPVGKTGIRKADLKAEYKIKLISE